MKVFMSLTTCLCRLAMLGRISSNSSREYCKCKIKSVVSQLFLDQITSWNMGSSSLSALSYPPTRMLPRSEATQARPRSQATPSLAMLVLKMKAKL